MTDRLDRRTFIYRAGGAGLTLTGLPAILAACGGVEGTQENAEEGNQERAETVSHPKT